MRPRSRPIASNWAIGNRSTVYAALYLWHYPVFAWTRQLHMSRYITGVVELVLAFAVACFSYYVVERRFLLLKNRFQSP